MTHHNNDWVGEDPRKVGINMKLLPIGTLGLAGVLGAGLMSFSGTTVAADDNDAYIKREEAATELVLVDDDDDADSNDNSRSRFTGFSRATTPGATSPGSAVTVT